MRVIPVDDRPPAAEDAAEPGFWQRVAQALDEYFVERTKRAVPEAELRRCRRDVGRVRRLVHGSAMRQRRSGPAPLAGHSVA